MTCVMNMTFYVKVTLVFIATPHPIIRNKCPQGEPALFCTGFALMERRLLCTKPVSPNQPREQVHHSNAKARREFISSALGPMSHPAQWNPTRAQNKGVWRLIYRQFFVSVTGVAGVTWLARQDERMSCLFLVNMTQVLEPFVWSLTVCLFLYR